MFERAFRSGELVGGDPESAFRPAHLRAALRGKNLAWWGPLDGPCHGDLLLEVANALADGDAWKRERQKSGSDPSPPNSPLEGEG